MVRRRAFGPATSLADGRSCICRRTAEGVDPSGQRRNQYLHVAFPGPSGPVPGQSMRRRGLLQPGELKSGLIRSKSDRRECKSGGPGWVARGIEGTGAATRVGASTRPSCTEAMSGAVARDESGGVRLEGVRWG